MKSQISIVVPCIKNSRLLNNSILEYLKVIDLKKIFIVLEELDEKNKINHDKIEYILVKKSSNMSYKRNFAAKKADTDYLAFYDSDSYPKNPNILELAIKVFNSDKNIYAVGGPDISPEGQNFYKRITGKLNKSFFISGFRNYSKNIYDSMYVKELRSCNLIVKKKTYFEMNGMNEKIYSAEDTDFCNRILNKGKSLYYIKELVAYHTDREIKFYFIQRYVRSILTAETTLNFLKKKFRKEFVSKGEFRYEYLLTPLLAIYIVATCLIYLFLFSNLIIFLPFVLFLVLIFLETLRIKELENFFPIFMCLFCVIIMQSFSSLLAFFGIKLNIKKIYRNENDL
jgi:GT2 family glycosyltransferase